MTQLRQRYVTELSKSHPELKTELVKDDQVDLIGPDGIRSSVFLDNDYQRYLTDPKQLDHVLDVAVKSDVEARGQWIISKDKLLVLVRPQAWLDMSDGREKPRPPLSRPFAQGLLVFIAVNGDYAIEFPAVDEVHKAMGQNDSLIWDVALRNVEELRGPVRAEPQPSGLVIISTNPNMASSILVDGAISGLPEVKALGSKVAVLIGEDAVVAGRSDDPKAIQALRDMVVGHPAEWVSDALYAPAPGGGWTELQTR
jgi:hypothetical protein